MSVNDSNPANKQDNQGATPSPEEIMRQNNDEIRRRVNAMSEKELKLTLLVVLQQFGETCAEIEQAIYPHHAVSVDKVSAEILHLLDKAKLEIAADDDFSIETGIRPPFPPHMIV